MQCVEECAVVVALIDEGGAVVAVPIGEDVVRCLEACAIGASVVD